MKLSVASPTTLYLMLAVTPAMAGTLYSNSPYNGDADAWTIGPPSTGFAVSDSFTCSAPNGCSVEGFAVVTWNFPGDQLLTLDASFGSSSFGSDHGSLIGIAPSGSTDLGANSYGYDLMDYEFTFANLPVPNGTSYITLSNAIVPNNDLIYWDENDGPSSAYQNTLGRIPSESFTITGTINGGTTPEPSSILLLGSGILGLAGILRRELW